MYICKVSYPGCYIIHHADNSPSSLQCNLSNINLHKYTQWSTQSNAWERVQSQCYLSQAILWLWLQLDLKGRSAHFLIQHFGHLPHFNTVCATYILHNYLWAVHGIDHQPLNVSYVECHLQLQPNMLRKKCTVRRKQFKIESYCHHEIELPLWEGSIVACLMYD